MSTRVLDHLIFLSSTNGGSLFLSGFSDLHCLPITIVNSYAIFEKYFWYVCFFSTEIRTTYLLL